MFLLFSIAVSVGVLLFFTYAVFKADFYNSFTTMVGITLSVVVSIFVFVGIWAIKEENSVVYVDRTPELNQYFWICDKMMINPVADIVEVKLYRDETWAIKHGMYKQFETEQCSEIEMVER